MRFYCVTWKADNAPEGIGGGYFRTKKEAGDCARDVRAVEVRMNAKCQCCKTARGLDVEQGRPWRCPLCGENVPGFFANDLHTEEINLTGTPREMCLQALRHQLRPG